MEMLYPGLTRPVLCGYRFYNQDVSPGALLIEIGGHANTVQQAVRPGSTRQRHCSPVWRQRVTAAKRPCNAKQNRIYWTKIRRHRMIPDGRIRNDAELP